MIVSDNGWTVNCKYASTAASTTTGGTYGIDWADATASSTSSLYKAVRVPNLKYSVSRDDLIVDPSPGDTLKLPDGSRLIIDDKGNHRIEDKDAKVTYQANRVREFSPHLNASDMVAQFVDYARSLGVKRDEVLALPLELFIGWLVIEAAERDNDPVPDDVVPVDRRLTDIVKPRCLSCNRFIPKIHSRNQFPFCDPAHAAWYVRNQKLLTDLSSQAS